MKMRLQTPYQRLLAPASPLSFANAALADPKEGARKERHLEGG
jgi:hypothetical protein